MRDRDFEFWLERVYKTAKGQPMDRRSRESRISNCRHVEEFHGSLDDHFKRDGMAGLLRLFEYSRDDEYNRTPPGHRIPISGCIYEGTATLKAAINLYRKFCQAWPSSSPSPRA